MTTFGDPRLPERFWAKVRVDELGCWNWTAAKQSRGYGSWGVDGKRRSTHRVSYEAFRGEIPVDMTIDHLCLNKLCCNPDHLEVVTIGENTRRGRSYMARKTVCIRGHLLTADNVYVNRRGNRTCKDCQAIHNRNRYERERQATQ